jgi:MraZ protein
MVMDFRGTVHRTLDTKGRLMLPAEFREALAQCVAEGPCMITTDDRCLMVRPWPEWEKFESGVLSVPFPSPKLRNYRRTAIGGAEKLVFDAQNRINLSRAHIEYAGLGREVILVGQVKHFEIWDAARFKLIQEQDFEGVDRELAESGKVRVPTAQGA